MPLPKKTTFCQFCVYAVRCVYFFFRRIGVLTNNVKSYFLILLNRILRLVTQDHVTKLKSWIGDNRGNVIQNSCVFPNPMTVEHLAPGVAAAQRGQTSWLDAGDVKVEGGTVPATNRQMDRRTSGRGQLHGDLSETSRDKQGNMERNLSVGWPARSSIQLVGGW